MKLILFFTATFVSASLAVVDLNGQWNRWKTDFDKYYSTSEDEANKRAVWEMNLEYVNAHNNDVQSEFRLAMNEFADQVGFYVIVFKMWTVHRRNNNPKTTFSDSNIHKWSLLGDNIAFLIYIFRTKELNSGHY